MKQQSYNFVSSSQKNHNSDSLFWGIWLRWEMLTQAEKVVSLSIILIPVWWCIGWNFVPSLLVASIAVYELKKHQTIHIEYPSLSTTALLLFSFYRAFTYIINTPEIAPRALLDPFLFWGCSGILLWYIQSYNIRIRLHVAAWAFSFVICTMLLWWSFFNFVLNEPYFVPSRTLTATLLDKNTSYHPTLMGSISNFLVPYYVGERGIGGFLRYTLFFPHPTVSSFAIGFAGLIVLDTKKPLWYLPVCLVCTFLILIAQARNAWLALSFVLVVRVLFTSRKVGGIVFFLSLMAVTSFITISVPTINDFLTETFTNTMEATSNFRKDSTDVRNDIYLRTWERVIEEPLIGHGINGSPVLPGFEYALIGTESFVLGTLLYKSGLIGSSIFMTFFISLITKLYQTRKDRPLSCLLMLIYLSLSSLVTEFITPEIFIVLLCVMMHHPENINSSSDRNSLAFT
jgi:hypothetical protein